MKLPRTSSRWPEGLLIDDALDAHVEWRDESAEALQHAVADALRALAADVGAIPIAEHPLERSAP